MTQKELKIGQRVWHPVFKWGTFRLPPGEVKSLVDFDFKECSYYIPGHGYKSFKKENRGNTIYLPNEELFSREIKVNELSEKIKLKIIALNTTLIL